MPKCLGERWMNVAETAEYLGVVIRTVYVLIDTDQLPAYKLGRVLRLKTEDVEAYLASQRVKPGDLSHLYPPGSDARERQPSCETAGGQAQDLGDATATYRPPLPGRRPRPHSLHVGIGQGVGQAGLTSRTDGTDGLRRPRWLRLGREPGDARVRLATEGVQHPTGPAREQGPDGADIGRVVAGHEGAVEVGLEDRHW